MTLEHSKKNSDDSVIIIDDAIAYLAALENLDDSGSIELGTARGLIANLKLWLRAQKYGAAIAEDQDP